MPCPNCGQPCRDGGRFCAACGSPIPTTAAGGTVILDAAQPVAAAGFSLAIRLPNAPTKVVPLTAPTLQIGSATSCDIRIADRAFAALSVSVSAHKGGYRIRDLQAAHGLVAGGVKVNEAALSLDEAVYAPGAGGKAVSFVLQPIARGIAGQVAGSQGLGIRFRRDQETLTIGRDPSNDVVVEYPLVSRFHARLERLAHLIVLHDLHSSNGTFIGGQRVRGMQELRVGDELQIGPARFIFRGETLEEVDAQPTVRIDAVDLERRAGRRGGKILLDRVALSILPREFVALIGGSGAGKSTLLHALAGVTPAQKGAVLYNGQDVYRSPGPFAGLIGYVPQDDILHRDLTVERALIYAARLRLPPDTSVSERERRIEALLSDVQMIPQRRQAISRLSGGQRKRVSIAVELLANPRVLFLDEPTSGLDPGLDKAVMHLLRGLCEQGRTVILVTHATENIGQCDLVAFMAGGRLVYYGPPGAAPEYFGADGFPDIYTLLADPEQSDSQELRFRQAPAYRTYVLGRQASLGLPPPPAGAAPPRNRRQVRAAALRQLAILTQRYAELVLRDRVNLGLLLAQTPIVATALTLVTSRDLYTGTKINNTQQILLMLSVATLWFGTTNAAREIVKERAVYLRERLVNLRLIPYVLSKVVVLATLGVLQVIVLFGIVALKTPHLPDQGILLPAPLEMVISLALCALAGLLGGLLISSLVRSTDRAMSIVPIVLIPQVIFSGAVFDLDGWARVLSYLTISHWCLAALGSTVKINEMATRLPVNGQAMQLNRAGTPLPDVVANWPKEMYSAPDRVHLLGYWGALLVFCVLFLLGIYAALRRGDVGIGKRATDGPSRRSWLLLTLPPVLLCSAMLLIGGLRASGQSLTPSRNLPRPADHQLPAIAAGQPELGNGTGAATLFTEPTAGRQPLLTALAGARHTVDLATYLFADPPIERALMQARDRGVQVRVLLEKNPVGGGVPADRNAETARRLRQAGIEVRLERAQSGRLHEKALVVDGRVALIMTLNFTGAAFSGNREFGAIDFDATDVREVASIFAADWRGVGFEPSDPNLLVSMANSRTRMLALLGRARRTVDLYMEYLSDPELRQSLLAASGRGVRVRAILANNASNRNVRDELVRGGISVALLDRPVIHAKAIIVDGRWAFVGSRNLTSAALDRNREIGVLLSSPAAIALLEAAFRADWPAAAGP